MQHKQCIRPMCSSLGWRHQSRLQCRLNRQWSKFRCKFPSILSQWLTIACRCKVLAVLFTTLGSAADYGSFGRWFLLVITCTGWAALFACMSLTGTYLIVLPHESTTLIPEIHQLLRVGLSLWPCSQ
jgi:hypothetical protein